MVVILLGNTTGKITSQHGLFYDYLVNTYSTDFAKYYLQANEEAIENIRRIIDTENIDCDFEYQDNYVFTNSEEDIAKIKHEVLAVNSLGMNAEIVDNCELPINILSAIKFPHQAQFNPLKYIYGLLKCIVNNGGKVYENSKVYDVKACNNLYCTYTKNYTVSSKYVVLACHYPFINVPGFYFLKMYQEASYVIGLETSLPLFNGMYINAKPPITSFRTAIYNGKRILLVGGSNHKVGEDKDVSSCYKDLENVAKSLYPDSKILFKWQTQDCVSLDKLPYIGIFSNVMPNVFVATGFKKWGMTTSNIASNIICDKILGKRNKYEDIFLSTRFKPIKNGTEFTNLLKEVSNSLIIDKFKVPANTLDTVNTCEGKIVEVDNIKIGVYRDDKNKIYAVKPFCTHLGCELRWNNLDKTWDCPCHGSRFNYDGKSLYSPSIKDLELLDLMDEHS